MADFDGTLKLLLRKSAHAALGQLTGMRIDNWLNEELPNPRSLRVDLLGRAADGALVHLELQRDNDPQMAFRMAEYGLGIYRLYEEFPRQFCLYVGDAKMRMPHQLQGPGFAAEYTLIDARTLDGNELLASPEVGDNLIAILAQVRDQRDAIHRIVAKVSGLPSGARKEALIQPYTLSGLRRLSGLVKREIEAMPIHIDLRENEVLGPPYIRGLEEGEQKGRSEGRKEAALNILRRQIDKRFGALPAWVEERLAAKSPSELEELSVRVLDAATFDDLLK
jgi:predicted transposase YdaD